ncbi:MAG TPA: PAS domain-containing protein [Acidothermaceae bacterium]
MAELGVDLGVVAIPESRQDGMSYLLIPLVQRPSPELAPLRETLRAWVTVVATSADACLVLDGDGRVAGVSASAAALVDEDPANIVGRRLVGDVFVIVDFSSAAEPIGDHAIVPPTQALHSDVLSRGLIRLRRVDDLTVTIDAIAAPLHAHDGSLIGTLTFFAPLASS